MVRMKLTKDEFDPKALDVKVEKSTFKRYRGEIPPNGTILIFRVTRMWWTQSNAGDSQIRVMAFAEQNKGALKKYNGLPVREYLTFNPDSAFRYQNFLHNFGLTTRDIFNKMDIEPEPDNIGDVINSIAGWVVGSDDALCRIAVVRDRYNPDELRAKVDFDGWLPLDEEDEADDDDEDEDDLDDEDDDDEPPARPTRTRGAARTRQETPSGRGRRREPEPEEDDEDEDEDIDEDDLDDEDEDDIDAEAEEAEEEAADEEEETEPPARTRRSRTTRASAASTRPARTARHAAGSSGRTQRANTAAQRTAPADGARRGSRTAAARTSSKARNESRRGSTQDPPF